MFDAKSSAWYGEMLSLSLRSHWFNISGLCLQIVAVAVDAAAATEILYELLHVCFALGAVLHFVARDAATTMQSACSIFSHSHTHLVFDSISFSVCGVSSLYIYINIVILYPTVLDSRTLFLYFSIKLWNYLTKKMYSFLFSNKKNFVLPHCVIYHKIENKAQTTHIQLNIRARRARARFASFCRKFFRISLMRAD